MECDFELVTSSPAAMVALIDKPPEQNVVCAIHSSQESPLEDQCNK